MYNIEKEIQEILDPLIFNASHELKGHCLFEHVISDRDLLLKLKWMRKAQGNEIVLASRFFSAEQARKAIYMLIGITERGDAGVDFSWEDPIRNHEVDAAVLSQNVLHKNSWKKY